MKILNDGTMVTSRSFYFLLDFNDRDGWETLVNMFNVRKLHDLDINQYIQLFEIATQKEIELLKSKIV
jgi:hypothetical protein